jgi:2-methylisocitrate lyase-like PEP mutase family enzyme
MSTLKEKAELLLSLHSRDQLLVLPNIWNPIGARVLQQQGYPAVATASAAISAALGFEDGEAISRTTAFEVIGRIAASVDVPVTADIERGYGESAAELEETAEMVLASGVAGLNIEDSLDGGAMRSVEEQCRRIATIREVAERTGVHLVINARIDSFVTPLFATPDDAMEDALNRAKAYTAAGADCIYPLGPSDEATVRALRSGIKGPLNILAPPAAAPLSTLQAIGVNRVSFGPFIFRSCLRKFSEITGQLKATGEYASFSDMMSRAEVAEFLKGGE